MEDVHITSNQAKHLQAYIEYHNIVGNADGGKLFTPEQYEEYKDNLKKNAKNRVYASWRNTKGMDCKTIGPSSMCFCGHRYKEHNSLNPVNKKVKCQTMKCSCPCFSHVPVHGSSDLKCLCKTSYADHDPATKKCPKGKMGSPSGTFVSTWSCSCGQKFNDHVTVIETREERIALGKPVDSGMGEMGNLMGGGLSNFSAMVEGAESHAAQVDAYVHGRKNNMALPYNQQYALTGGSQKLGIEDGMSNLSLQSKHAGTVSLQGDVEGGISAYDLFNMPHQFARPKYGGGMGTGTGLKKAAIRY